MVHFGDLIEDHGPQFNAIQSSNDSMNDFGHTLSDLRALAREFFPHVEKDKKKEIWSCKSRIGQFLYRKFLAACRALYRWNMPKDEELFKKQNYQWQKEFFHGIFGYSYYVIL